MYKSYKYINIFSNIILKNIFLLKFNLFLITKLIKFTLCHYIDSIFYN